MNIPSQILPWIYERSTWWSIICGAGFNVSDNLLKEILLKLIEESRYELAFVLLKTHESNRSIEYAVTRAIANFADETFMKNYLLDVANHLGTQTNPHSA